VSPESTGTCPIFEELKETEKPSGQFLGLIVMSH
jgi:hypothetical protein